MVNLQAKASLCELLVHRVLHQSAMPSFKKQYITNRKNWLPHSVHQLTKSVLPYNEFPQHKKKNQNKERNLIHQIQKLRVNSVWYDSNRSKTNKMFSNITVENLYAKAPQWRKWMQFADIVPNTMPIPVSGAYANLMMMCTLRVMCNLRSVCVIKSTHQM